MIKLDTTKLKIPIGTINEMMLIKSGSWDKNSKNDITTSYTFKEKKVGMKSALYSPISETLQVEFSAKILKDEYLEGINQNTIERVFDSLESTFGITIPHDSIEQSEVLRCDFTQMLEWDMSKYWLDVKHAIHLSCIDQNYQINNYNKKGNGGIEIKGLFSSKKDRLIIYPKYQELSMNNASNRAFAKECKNFPLVVKNSINKARVEVNSTTFKDTRSLAKCSNIKLLSVLNSTAKPNYDSVSRLMKNNINKPSIITCINSDESLRDIERMRGITSIIQECMYNENILISLLKMKVGIKNWHREWNGRNGNKGYKHYLIEEKSKLQNPKKELNYLIDDFMDSLLKVS